MNPLVVARSVSKQIDLLLRNGDPVANCDFLAHTSRQFRKCLKSFHAADFSGISGGDLSILGQRRLGLVFYSVNLSDLFIKPFANTLPLFQIFFNTAAAHIKQA